MPYPAKNTKTYSVNLTTEQAAALRRTALALGLTYDSKPSITKLIQRWADFLGGKG